MNCCTWLLLCFFTTVHGDSYVFAIATGYPWGLVDAFVKSAHFAGLPHIWIGVRAAALPEFEQRLTEYPNVRFVPVEPAADLALFLWRWQLYSNWTRMLALDDWVLTADVRDTVFQANPFAELYKRAFAPINLFEEDRSMTIGSCPHNSGWIRGCWGVEAVTRLGANHILCGGNTLGQALPMRNFWTKMLAVVLAMPSRSCLGGGIDQGVLNYFYYTEAFNYSTVKVWRRGTGPVNTVGYINPASLPLNDGGFIVNDDHSLSPVVHQYDRFPQLANKYHTFAWTPSAPWHRSTLK